MIGEFVLLYYGPQEAEWQATEQSVELPDGGARHMFVTAPASAFKAHGAAALLSQPLVGLAGGGLAIHLLVQGGDRQIAIFAPHRATLLQVVVLGAEGGARVVPVPPWPSAVAIRDYERWIVPVDAEGERRLLAWREGTGGLQFAAQESVWSVLRRPSLDTRLAWLERSARPDGEIAPAGGVLGNLASRDGADRPIPERLRRWLTSGADRLTVIVTLLLVLVIWVLTTLTASVGGSPSAPTGTPPAVVAPAAPVDALGPALSALRDRLVASPGKATELGLAPEGLASPADWASAEKGWSLVRLSLAQRGITAPAAGGEALVAAIKGKEGTPGLPAEDAAVLAWFQANYGVQDVVLAALHERAGSAAPSGLSGPAAAMTFVEERGRGLAPAAQ